MARLTAIGILPTTIRCKGQDVRAAIQKHNLIRNQSFLNYNSSFFIKLFDKKSNVFSNKPQRKLLIASFFIEKG